MEEQYFGLTIKHFRFIIRALEEQIAEYEEKMADESTDEDEYSDMANDLPLMKEALEVLKSKL